MEHGHRLSSFSYSICMALVIPTATPPLLVVNRCITGSAQAWSTTAKINFGLAFVFGLVLLYIANHKAHADARARMGSNSCYFLAYGHVPHFMPYDSIVTVASRDGETKDGCALWPTSCAASRMP